MLKKALLFSAVIIFSGGLFSAAMAETPVATETVVGVISKLDLDAASPWINVNSGGKDVKILLDHASRGYKDKIQIPLADLKAGEQVKVDTVENNGATVVKTLELL